MASARDFEAIVYQIQNLHTIIALLSQETILRNEILLRSYDIELTRSFFCKKFCCLTKRMVENILGNFCKTNFEIFEQNRAAILREN